MPDDPTAQSDRDEIIRRANEANILKKLKAGKPLTATELDVLAGTRVSKADKAAAKAKREEEKAAEKEATKQRRRYAAGYVAERCKYWGCRPRTIQMMKQEGLPIDDDEAMIKWYSALSHKQQSMLAPSFKQKLFEVRAKLAGTTVAAMDDNELKEFESQYHPSAEDQSGYLAEIKRGLAESLFRAKKARARRDTAAEDFALKQFRNFADVLNDLELRAKRLGRDLGESFSADDVDRLGRSVGFWMTNAASAVIDKVTPALLAASAVGLLDREVVRKVVEPVILGELVVGTLARAAKVTAPIKLPARFVEAVKAGVALCIEDGAKEFESI